MADVKNEYGVVGLGRMGGNLARQALDKAIRVVDHYRDGPDIAGVLRWWRRSWLIDLMEAAYHTDGGTEKIKAPRAERSLLRGTTL